MGVWPLKYEDDTPNTKASVVMGKTYEQEGSLNTHFPLKTYTQHDIHLILLPAKFQSHIKSHSYWQNNNLQKHCDNEKHETNQVA